MRVVFLAISILLAAASCAFAQSVERPETIRVDIRLVSVPVVVADRNARYVPDLAASDFTILQDGEPQSIEFFAAVEELAKLVFLRPNV